MFMSHGPGGNHRRAIFERFEDADAFLNEQGTDSYQFGRQSGWLERADNGYARSIGLRYHDTYVVKLWSNGDTEFDTGGWYTNSTAAWMRATTRFDVYLYQCRSGERKPYRYSTIRFAGHDRNIERELRDEWGMPPRVSDAKGYVPTNYISAWTFREYDSDLGEYRITDPVLHERAQYFQDELTRRKLARHPTYVYEDGITFTRRGRCHVGELLRDAVAKERAERKAENARRRKVYGRLRAYRNRVEQALASTIPVDDLDLNGLTAGQLEDEMLAGEVNPSMVFHMVSGSLPGDVRTWLNLHEANDRLVMGDCPPVIRTVVARKMYEAAKAIAI